MENRGFTRVGYSVGASVRYGDNVIIGNTENVSLRGMYLKTDDEIPFNIPVHVTVYCSSMTSLKFNAKAVRSETDGVGLQITNLNVNSFLKLRDIISQHSNNQGRVMQETYKMLKCVY